ncbi:MAG: dihydrolipoamide acetyltransferase family protein [Nitrospiria bacterium]
MANRVVMPKLTDTMEEGVLLKWYKKEGESVESGDAIAEVETDKAVMDLEAFASGILKKILVPEGNIVPSGDLIALIAREDEDIKAILAQETMPRMRRAGKKDAVTSPPPSHTGGTIKASPLARKMAKARGIDLKQIKGTGPGGRVTQRDIEGGARISPRISYGPAGAAPEGEEVELSMLRKAVATRMVQSKAPVPHFYVTSEIDMGKILAFRDALGESADPAHTKPTLTDLFLKAVALTLERFPSYRSTYRGGHVRISKQIDVGLAIGLPDGVITAVIRNCGQKTLSQISLEVKEKVNRARAKGLKPEEYTGAVFSVSNLGMYDVESFSAIITPPESAVLAIGSIQEKPIVSDGKIVIGKTVKVTLSTDHRVADGVQAAEFLKELKRIIQNPLHLAL